MKTLLTISFLAFSLLSFGQNYKLFNASSQKLFAYQPAADSTIEIAFDSIIMVGNDSVYYNYTELGNQFASDTCQFWGGPFCTKQDKPSWLGYLVIYDNISQYKFFTNLNDTLSFNFNLMPGDSSLFYQDASQRFYFQYEGSDTATVLGTLDSLKYYRISHYDLSGNSINLALNNERIVIGKEIGLIDFFKIDLFPFLLKPVSLIGNLSPAGGIISLTNEMIYDHQIGDEIQYLDEKSNLDGPPWLNYKNYIKYVFLGRVDTQDSIIYTVERLINKTDSNLLLMDTITLRYNKSGIKAHLPFAQIDQNNILLTKRFYKADYCNFSLWTYSATPQYLAYCDLDNCWGDYDIPGPPPSEKTIFVCGLGLYLDRSSVSVPPPIGYSSIHNIIYFKKDGIQCGNEAFASIEDHNTDDAYFSVYPNPTTDILYVKSKLNSSGILLITNVNGQELRKITITDQHTTIDISDLKNGMYLIKYKGDSFVSVKKIIKE